MPKPPRKSNAGKPTDYSKHVAISICSHLREGKDIETAMTNSGLVRSTYYKWRNEIPEFKDMTDQANDFYMKHIAEASILKLANGDHKTVITKVYKRINKETGKMEVKGEETIVTDHPPDTNAVKFILRHRFRKKWNNPTATQIDITKMPTDQLQALAKECLNEIEGKEIDD